ncbi:MAG TPA: AAA family ATPase [Tepidisphaeraceae bacterium]
MAPAIAELTRPAAPRSTIRDVSSTSPVSLDSFVGQTHVVEAVQVGLDACRQDGTRFPHSLFVGPPGLGKSNLVQIIAQELGVELRETLGQTLVQSSDLAALLLEAEDQQIIFIDEADELAGEHQTLLYRALAERKLFLQRGRGGKAARSLDLENFTLILASNHESRLARPLVDRFKMLCRFEFYASPEILRLLEDRIAALGWQCEEEVLSLLAQRSRGVPRLALRLLESARRTSRSQGADILCVQHFDRMCRIEGIDQRGLDRTERAYLHILATAKVPVRLGVIADRLGLPSRTISGVIEAFLVRQGLISRSDDGRQLTEEGASYIRETVVSVAP